MVHREETPKHSPSWAAAARKKHFLPRRSIAAPSPVRSACLIFIIAYDFSPSKHSPSWAAARAKETLFTPQKHRCAFSRAERVFNFYFSIWFFPKHSPVCRPARENFFPSEKAGPLSATHPLYFLRVKSSLTRACRWRRATQPPRFLRVKSSLARACRRGYAWGKSYAIIKTRYPLRTGEGVAVSYRGCGGKRVSP